ncbi:lactonase family protein [Ruania suaedae]|uniref:lactonase family protein n=1 Tax=Ruania suaedae TaxID=2897774 RepID=UPI001E3CAAC3|nr:beta-propeller fold lactonase family protein [Ruania suaedae]UFU03513.1 lactonase family protein [Ruania suaedae]
MGMNFLLGTEGDGPGQGIWRVSVSGSAGWSGAEPELVAQAPAPTFLALHPTAERVYAVGEGAKGSVTSFDMRSDCSLRPTARVSSGGAGPCHLLVHPWGQWLYVANYGDGTACAIRLDEAGDVTDDNVVLAHHGSGPVADRQEGPHAHFCALSEGGGWLLVSDLGTDQLRAYPLEDGRPADTPVLTDLPAGCGPRHLVVGDGLLYLAGELSGEVLTLAWDEELGQARVLHRGDASGRDGGHQLSHLARSGPFLYVGVRGTDTLATLRIAEDGESTERVAEVSTAGWPRHHAVTGHAVVVAGQEADRLAVHPLQDGIPGEATTEIELPRPMCVLPL